MQFPPRKQPEFLLWSIPFWIAAALLAAYVLFGRGGDGGQEPRLLFSQTTLPVTPTLAPPTPTTPPSPSPTTPPTATATPVPVTYTVQAGDSLTSICASELPQLPDCVQAVVTLNKLAGPDVIAVGQVLQLPPASP